MPWDLIFYGAMAAIFIGVIVVSAWSRMTKRQDDRGGDIVGEIRASGS